MQAFAASKQLCDSITQEQALVLNFLQRVNHEVLTEVQEAQVMVRAW